MRVQSDAPAEAAEEIATNVRTTEAINMRHRFIVGLLSPDRSAFVVTKAGSLELHQLVGRARMKAMRFERSDIFGSDVERLQLDQRIDRKVRVAHLGEAPNECGIDLERGHLLELIGGKIRIASS